MAYCTEAEPLPGISQRLGEQRGLTLPGGEGLPGVRHIYASRHVAYTKGRTISHRVALITLSTDATKQQVIYLQSRRCVAEYRMAPLHPLRDMNLKTRSQVFQRAETFERSDFQLHQVVVVQVSCVGGERPKIC